MKKDILTDLSFEDVEKAVTNGNRGKDDKSKTKAGVIQGDKRFTVVEVLGKLSESKTAPIFAVVDWNGYRRYDLRKWNDDMTVPFKGITFTDEEMEIISQLKDAESYDTDVTRAIYRTEKMQARVYDCIARLAEESVRGETWYKEINLIDWGYGKKVDFRKWTDSYAKCSKGISISSEEFRKLLSLAKRVERG